MYGTEKLELPLVVWRHDGEPVDGQNGSNGGPDRPGPTYILYPVECSVCLPYFLHSVFYPQNYV
jgi:hypothetical protein